MLVIPWSVVSVQDLWLVVFMEAEIVRVGTVEARTAEAGTTEVGTVEAGKVGNSVVRHTMVGVTKVRVAKEAGTVAAGCVLLGENGAVVTVGFETKVLSPGISSPRLRNPGSLVKVQDAKIKKVRVAK